MAVSAIMKDEVETNGPNPIKWDKEILVALTTLQMVYIMELDFDWLELRREVLNNTGIDINIDFAPEGAE